MALKRFDVRAGAHICRPLLLPALVLAAISPAAAQTVAADNTTATAAAQQTEVITVTGTRRREPVRDVPVQIGTLWAEDLEQAGARNLTDYLATQPGVDLKSSGGAGLGTLTIRGLSSGDPTIPTVGMYIDDVPFGTSTAYAFPVALDMGLLDLNRVEILRGPQGTLYGASTMGGLIKYVTNDPDPTRFSGRAMASFAATSNGSPSNTVSAVVNAPLSENVAAVRVAAFRDHFGGYIDSYGPAAASDSNSGNTVGGRISVLVTPVRNLQVKLNATSQEIKRDGQDTVDYDAATGNPVNGSLSRKLALREPYSVKTNVLGLEIEYDMGWGRLNSSTSDQKTDIAKKNDVTFVYGPLLAGFGLDLDQVALDNSVSVHRQVQELRLTSPRGTIEWLAGYFYNHEKSDNGQLVTSRFTAGAAPGPQLATVDLPAKYTENALFGDLTWNSPTRDLSLTGGVRGAENKQSFSQITDGPLVGGASNLHGDSSETTRTYLATARYALTKTSNVYARAANGYRPGGPNVVVLDPNTGQPLAPTTFKSDSLWSYEVGYKADLDRTLSVDAALYDIKWKDMQQFSAVNGISVIVNAGQAQVDGAELSLHYRPTAQWVFDAAYTYIDARLTEDAPGLGASGARLPNSAKHSAHASATYLFEAYGHHGQAGADLHYVGDRNAGFEGSSTLPNYKLPSYTLFDLHASVDFRVVQVGLFARNLADKRAQLGASTTLVPLGGYVQVTPVQPRTIGVSVSGTF
jgi:outer membrane receptor protein involved in Fe transport